MKIHDIHLREVILEVIFPMKSHDKHLQGFVTKVIFPMGTE